MEIRLWFSNWYGIISGCGRLQIASCWLLIIRGNVLWRLSGLGFPRNEVQKRRNTTITREISEVSADFRDEHNVSRNSSEKLQSLSIPNSILISTPKFSSELTPERERDRSKSWSDISWTTSRCMSNFSWSFANIPVPCTPVCSKVGGFPPPRPTSRQNRAFRGAIAPESPRKAILDDLECLGRLFWAIPAVAPRKALNPPNPDMRSGGILQFCYKQEYILSRQCETPALFRKTDWDSSPIPGKNTRAELIPVKKSFVISHFKWVSKNEVAHCV